MQYRESDLDFVDRLLQDEGITYFFVHETDKHTLVLANAPGAHASFPSYETVPYFAKSPFARRERDHVHGWDAQAEVRSGSFVHTSFDFEKPRADPRDRLTWLIDDDSPLVRARALRLAGELGRVDGKAQLLARRERETDESCRFWSAWSLGLLGERAAAASALCPIAEAPGPFRWRALDLVLRIMPQERSYPWLKALDADPVSHPLTTVAAGVLGDPAFIPWLIARMRDPLLGRSAGEALAMITGVDLAYQDLQADPPKGLAAGPSDDAADENVGHDPDEHLPWPDPDKVRSWWETQGASLQPGRRHLLGRPLDEAACRHALHHGFQRQRRAGACELACARAGAALANVRERSLPLVRFG